MIAAISAGSPDGQGSLERDYGPSSGKSNLARFQLAAFDAIYEKLEGEQSPAGWAQRFRASPAYRTYVSGRLEEHYGPAYADWLYQS